MPAGEHADLAIPSDRREIALVSVMKALAPLTQNRVDHISGGGAAALHRRGRHARYWLAFTLELREVADDEDVRMTGDAQVVVHNDASRSIDGGSELSAKR